MPIDHTERARLRTARAELAAADTAYRVTWRRVITTGLLTAAQLRDLGLPAPDARRRPRPTPGASPAAPTHPKPGPPPDHNPPAGG